MTFYGEYADGVAEEYPDVSTLCEVRRICGKPDRELSIEQDSDTFIALVYVVDDKEFFLLFSGNPETPNWLLRGPERFTEELKLKVADDYKRATNKPLPLSWQ